MKNGIRNSSSIRLDMPAMYSVAHLGERRLLAALLATAGEDLRRPPGQMRSEAEAWIRADSWEPGGFAWACSALKLDAPSVRFALLCGRYRSLPASAGAVA